MGGWEAIYKSMTLGCFSWSLTNRLPDPNTRPTGETTYLSLSICGQMRTDGALIY